MVYGTWYQRIQAKLRHHPWRSLRKAFQVRYWVKFLRETWGGKAVESAPLEMEELVAAYEPFELPKYDNPRVSIIVPVFNQSAYTYRCLKSIAKFSGAIPYEVLLGDDCSTDDTVRFSEIITNLRVVRHKENLRFLRNCNMTASQAKGEFLVLLNNDTNVQDGWLEALLELMEHDPSIGLVGSKLLYPDGRLQEAGGIIWEDGSGWNYGRLDDPDLPQYNYVKEVDYISGASIMVRSSLWRHLGGFDEAFAPAYYEDTDLAFQVRKAGYKVVFQPRSRVVHFEGVSNGTDLSSGIKKHQVENQQRLREKWRLELQSFHYPNAVSVIRARDRTREKPYLLFVDHYVPWSDKDAGSRNATLYIRLLCEMGYKVFLLGDNFYPHQPYTDQFQQLGVEVLVGNWFAQNFFHWFEENAKEFTAVILSRPHITEKYLSFMRKFEHLKLVYHGHDLHGERIRRQAAVENNPELLKEASKWDKLEDRIFASVDRILTVSESEKRLIEKRVGDPQKVVWIPLYFFANSHPGDISFQKREGLVFVGGFRHPPNLDGVNWFVREVLPIVVKSVPEVHFTIIGSAPPTEVLSLSSKFISVRSDISDEELLLEYQKAKLMVIPLRFGAGVKGKTIEAMQYGLPFVSTSIGLEGLAPSDTLSQPVDGAEEFAQQVVRFLRSETDWHRVRASNQAYCSQNFSTEVARDQLKKALSWEA